MWTIDELGDEVARALATDYDGAPSARVRDIPDRRTIRYYTTLGLIDRPAAMRGRTALYGPKHLLQLVAIKRLQARGLSLAEVQGSIAGAGVEALQQIAAIRAPEAAPITEETARRDEAFWGSLPADDDSEDERGGGDEEDDGGLLTGVHVGDDVILLFSPRRAMDAGDRRALAEAARPLVRLLRARGLT